MAIFEAGYLADTEGLGDDARIDPSPVLARSQTFEEVYRELYARMVRVAFAITGDADASEEVVQDAYVALLARFATVADPAGYLYRSVVNGCRARFRRKSVTDRLIRLRVVGEVASPEVDETRIALDRLSARARTVVVLRYYADLTTDDIAGILGCRPGTVRSLLHRALTDLKEVVVR